MEYYQKWERLFHRRNRAEASGNDALAARLNSELAALETAFASSSGVTFGNANSENNSYYDTRGS